MPHAFLRGKLDVNALLAFAFGVIFLTTMLAFATLIPNPSGFSQWVFAVTTSLAGAGIGAVTPGILNITLPYARAGGALAVFLIVFLNKPALVDAVGKFVPPASSPLPVALDYLTKVDAKDLDAAWSVLDSEAKATVARDRDMYRAAYAGGRFPLGEVSSRTQIGLQQVTSPNGYPPGIYSVIVFKTRFASGLCHAEQVSARATTDMVWRAFDHNVSVAQVPC